MILLAGPVLRTSLKNHDKYFDECCQNITFNGSYYSNNKSSVPTYVSRAIKYLGNQGLKQDYTSVVLSDISGIFKAYDGKESLVHSDWTLFWFS